MASIANDEDLVNVALARIGNRAISDLDNDTSNEAVKARALYFNVRDSLIRSHTWNFLTKRAQLTDSASDPTFGWDEGYTLPSDFMRIVDVLATDSQHDRIPYRLERQVLGTAATASDVILCNSSTLFLIYIYKETDPAKWIASFQDAVAWRLAAELSLALQLSGARFDRLNQQAERALIVAKGIDGQEDWPRPIAEGTWVTDRGITNDWDGTPQ